MKTSPAGISSLLVFAAEGSATDVVSSSEFETEHGTAEISKIRSLTMKDGKVLMEAVFADISAEELETMLDDAGINWRDDKGDPGLTITSFVTAAGTVRTFLSGFIDPTEVLNLPSVVSGDGYFISATPIGYQTAVGATTSQGDAAQRSDDARTQFGVDGTGITVGVLSDSFGAEQNADGVPTDTTVADDIASDDLPDDGVLVLREGAPFSPDGDEGRGMLQIIHDVAPGADLAFHTAGGGQAVFAQGILALRNTANADVIVDDIIYFAEPIFQDGIIAQAVDQVVADGAVYLSSAGNNGDDGFLDVYRDSGVDGDTIAAIAAGTGQTNLGNLHDWNDDPTVTSLYVELTLADGEDFSLSFQFDEAYASAGGAGSTADYDIFVTTVDSMGNETLEASGIGFANNINSDPIEIVDATNDSGGTQTYRIYITQFDAPDNVSTNLLAGIFFSSAGGFLEEDFNPEIISTLGGGMSAAPQFGAPTVFGHSNAAGALAVGASAFFNTPEFGLDPARLNSFSSLSGYDILFDALGNRLVSPDVRDGVDFTAPDGGNTTFFGTDSGADADSFPNFFGTSAAAPHAAAIVALMLELNPNITPTEVEAILEGSGQTISLDSSGRSVGTDFTGTGLIDAVAALTAVPVSSFDGTEGNDNLTGNNNDNTLRGFGGNDTLDGAGGNDTVFGGLGDDVLFGSSGDNLLVGDEDDGSAVAAGIDPLAPVVGGGATNGTDPLPEDRFMTQVLVNRDDEFGRVEEESPGNFNPLAAIFGDIFNGMIMEDDPYI